MLQALEAQALGALGASASATLPYEPAVIRHLLQVSPLTSLN